MVKRIVSAGVRRLGLAMMKCMPVAWRACVLEDLDNEMITEVPVAGGTIRFYKSGALTEQQLEAAIVDVLQR